MLYCFQKEEMSKKLVHRGGAMIGNVNVMLHHQAVTRNVIRTVIGVVVAIAEMTVSVMTVSVMNVLVTIVSVMIAPVIQVQVSLNSQGISVVKCTFSLYVTYGLKRVSVLRIWKVHKLGDVGLLYELTRRLTSSLKALFLVFTCHVIKPKS